MKKIIFLASLLGFSATITTGQVFMTRTGKVVFDATTSSSPEKISGKNNEVASILDTKTGDLRFQVLINSFKFTSALMQEHFNENYMESEKFPRSEFKGSLTNLSEINFGKDGVYKATVSGKLTIHGVTRDVTIQGTITVQGTTVVLKSKFTARLEDYNISIPSLVADKLAKVASISYEGDLLKK